MFAHIDPAFLEEILRLLAPTFIAGANGSIAAARQAALASLAAYNAQTEQEIRLAAQITLSGFIILETLAQSMNPDLACNTVLRLRGNANAMQRALNQCQRALDKLQKARRQAEQQPHLAATAEPPAPEPVTTPADPEPASAPGTPSLTATRAPASSPKPCGQAPSQQPRQTASTPPSAPAPPPALRSAA